MTDIDKLVTRMKLERKSPRTIDMYRYCASKFLDAYPKPTRIHLREYLAAQLEGGTCATAAKGIQKAITSLFRFLAKERFWSEDITDGLERIKFPRTERYLSPIEDVYEVMESGRRARKKDADKMRLLMVLLAETGLRITEAVTIKKDKLELDARTVEFVGKGDKVRTVPLSAPVAEYLK